MGKILETTYHDTIENITSFYGDLINNSFYTINDKKPTIVTYYNINKDLSSLDPGSKLSYDNIGKDTPLRFNKINDFIIYGFNRIELQTDNDEYGLEAEKITGDCVVLPNTIIPTEGDYFEVEHIKDSTWLFIVTDVQRDTLANGSNAYKLSYKLEYTDNTRIQEAVVHEFTMIQKREGTNIVKVVRNDDLELAKLMDKAAVTLKDYFNELYYNEKVQTFTYVDLTEWRMYDPFMIEFLIRNKILDNGSDSYIYVAHALEPNKTFTIDYDKTFFRAFEKKDYKNILRYDYNIYPEDIKSFGTLFASRFEPYFKAKYTSIKPPQGYYAPCLREELLYDIHDHILSEQNVDSKPLWRNILIKYFYDEEYTEEELESLMNELKFNTSMGLFYLMPLLILCLKDSIEKALR